MSNTAPQILTDDQIEELYRKETTLKCCPFCSSSRVSFSTNATFKDYIQCSCCKAEGPPRETKEKARKAWNQRG